MSESDPGERLGPSSPAPTEPEVTQRRSRRRRRGPPRSQPEAPRVATESVDLAPGQTAELPEEEAELPRLEPAPARRRGKRSDSPIAVNVDVPRGLGRRVNSKLIQDVAQLALQREGWSTPASLDVLIVNDEEMREINATRRGIDEATDVLSFPLLELRPEAGLAEDFFVLPPEAQVHLGDVVISYSRVESQADEAGHLRERELAFLTVHAVLHILGYDHDTEDKRRRMRRREEDVLIELGLRRNGA
jgi:probable rRNA maturation factor